MGCGASNAKDEPLSTAVAVQSAHSGAQEKPTESAAPLTLAAAESEQPAIPYAVAGARGPAVVSASAQSSVLRAYEAADASFGADPTPASVASLQLDAAAIDRIDSSFASDSDVGTVVECLGDSETPAGAAGLFSEASSAASVEVTPAAIAELLLLAGGPEDACRLMVALDKRQVRLQGTVELAGAMASQQADEVAALCGLLPSNVRQAVLDAYAFLALPSCELYPYATVPRVIPGGSVSASSDSAPKEEDETSELDFNFVNQQLAHTRMRLAFLRPEFLVALVVACAGCGNGSATLSSKVLELLHHLTLMESLYELPSELLRGALAHRANAIQVQTSLQQRLKAAPDSIAALTVPEALAVQLAPLMAALAPVAPAVRKLAPLMAPLIPTLSSLTPTLRHLQTYLARFLPLLSCSISAAKSSNPPLTPEQDQPTLQILRAYLLPFLSLMQPWLVQLRPYFAGLQPFFEALQPALVHTHNVFGKEQTFARTMGKQVDTATATAAAGETADSHSDSDATPAAPLFLLDPAFSSSLSSQVSILALLHPLLRQLHPLCQGLLSFCSELAAFLEQLNTLLDTLQMYNTLPPAEAKRKDGEEEEQQEHSQSSLAKPWFRHPSEAAEDDMHVTSAPQLLSRHDRFLRSRLRPFVGQLLPFVVSIGGFVAPFAPFAQQLAPFYALQLKENVGKILTAILHKQQQLQRDSKDDTNDNDNTVVAAATEAPTEASAPDTIAAASAAPEMDDAALQRLLSS